MQLGPGIKEHHCFAAQEPKGLPEMVIDKVRGIDWKGRQVQLLALLLSTVLDLEFDNNQKRENSAGQGLLQYSDCES